MALRSLTFEYRGVAQPIMAIRAGGRLDFETMSNGVPVIRSWHVRSPKVGYLRGGYIGARWDPNGERVRVVEVNETGGLITRGRLADGTILSTPLATLGGRALNDRLDEPVPGVRVTLDSTDYSVVADSSGQFSIEEVLPGPYTLRVRDSTVIVEGRLDSTQKTVADSRVQQIVTRVATLTTEARIGHIVPTDVRMPWRARVPGCGTADDDFERRYFVVGDVRSHIGEPVPHARVRLSWGDSARATKVETLVDATADAGGRFFMCGIPAEVRLASRVVTSSGGDHRGTTRVNRNERDEQGRRQTTTVRTIKLVIPKPDSAAIGRP
jgi:hypothetical protein